MNTSFSSLGCWLVLAFAVSGCGDGVGQPIKKDSSSIDGSTGSAYCQSVAVWDEDAAREEEGLRSVLNIFRENRVGCGAPGGGPPLAALELAPELRCSARRHARDMAERGYFSEVNPEGETVGVRAARAGYRSANVGEVILSQGDLGEALTASLGEACAELGDPRFVAAGVGKFGSLWALDFAGLPEP